MMLLWAVCKLSLSSDHYGADRAGAVPFGTYAIAQVKS